MNHILGAADVGSKTRKTRDSKPVGLTVGLFETDMSLKNAHTLADSQNRREAAD